MRSIKKNGENTREKGAFEFGCGLARKRTIILVEGRPPRIIPIVEGPTLNVEFIGKHLQ